MTAPLDRDGFVAERGAEHPERDVQAAVVLRCRGCRTPYPPGLRHACPACLDPRAVAAGPASIWRYQELLPARPGKGDLAPGLTPLRPAPRLAEALGVPGPLWLKDDAVPLAKARELGLSTAACASTGNLAGATAAAAASHGLECVVVIPAGLEVGKVASAAAFGATVVAVEGSYDQANRVSAQAAEEFGWGFVNVNLRPWYAEGSLTVGLEVAEQLGWSLPDHVVVPVASGALLTKLHQGFGLLAEAGLVDGGPARVHGAQSDGCAPVATAFAEGRDQVLPVRPSGIVKSLGIGDPADGTEVLEVVRSTGGRVEAVADDEVVEAIRLLARTTGVFGETAAGVTVATLARLAAAGALRQGERVVALVTGHGLKTIEVLDGRVGPTVTIRPNVDALEAALQPIRPGLLTTS